MTAAKALREFAPMRYCLAWMAMLMVLAGCSSAGGPGKTAGQGFETSQFGKSDIDRIAEAHLRSALASLQLVAEKLYRRNPREWKKGGWTGPEAAVQRLFGSRHNWRFPELDGRFGADAVHLALNADYPGDRVFALIAGLGGMTLAAFNERYEFFITDDLDPQRLYNAARNVEIAAWKLANAKGPDGVPLLLSNEWGPPANLSFEREFGRLIGNLDMISAIIADKTNRTVVKVVQTMATAVFLPVAGLK